MSKWALLFVFTMMLSTLPCLAQTTGFTGAWVLDVSASELRPGATRDIRLDVVADAGKISVTERRETSTERLTCTIDGKPCMQKTASRGDYVLKVLADKGALAWTITVTRSGDNASMTYSEHWSLSDGGKTLSVSVLYPNGMETLRVFKRQQ
jgi:hypothetical protein